MRRVRLARLRLEAFRGVRELEVRPGGEDAVVRGANGTGKTTLADAWFWLVTGADSDGCATFQPKQLGADGEPTGRSASVEAEVEVDGRTVTLKKTYREVWTKKRGSAEGEFDGHTTDHWFDGVPVQAAEYAARLASIASPAEFRLGGDPSALLARLDWRERRAAVSRLCGAVPAADVLDQTGAAELAAAMAAGASLEDVEARAKADRRAAQERLREIPARLDEARRACDAEPVDEREAAAAHEALEQARARLAAARADGAGAARAARVSELEAKVAQAELAALERAKQAAAEAAQAEAAAREAAAEAASLRRALEEAKAEETAAADEADRLRAEYEAARAAGYDGLADECPACGQPVPENRKKAALEQFNAEKAARLEAIVAKGKAARAAQAEAAKRAYGIDAEARQAEAKAEALAAAVRAVAAPPDDGALAAAKAELAAAKACESDETALEPLRQAVLEAAEKARDVDARRARWDASEAARARIVQLERELDDAKAALAAADVLLHQAGLYRDKEAKMMEDRAAAATPGVRWRLFRRLVNGGLEPCCEAEVGGVPYPALNRAAQVHAGVAVANAVARSRGVAVPVWIDGAESVTTLPECVGQRIALAVDAEAATIQVERELALQGTLI